MVKNSLIDLLLRAFAPTCIQADNHMEDLKKWYGLEKLEQIGPIHEFKITGKYRNQTLKEILQSISYSTGIAYELNDKQLKITTK